MSASLSLPYRPLVVVTGGRLTDVADAYLIDPTVTERVVVVSSMGSTTATGGAMGPPNGEMDPWADAIVTAHFRFVQVSAYYDQTTDVPTSRLAELPDNAFGDWIAAKQPSIFNLAQAANQVAVVAVGISSFVTGSAEGLGGRAHRRRRHGRTRARRRCGRPPSARHPKRWAPRRRSDSGNSSPIRTPIGRSRRLSAVARGDDVGLDGVVDGVRRYASGHAPLRRTSLRPCGCCRRRFPG